MGTETIKPSVVKLLDHLLVQCKLKNDAALAQALEVDPPVISNLRHDRRPLGPALLLRVHEMSGMPFVEIRRMAGIGAKA